MSTHIGQCMHRMFNNKQVTGEGVRRHASMRMDARMYAELLKVVECPVCLDTFKRPRSLPCLHCFCELCLETHIQHTLTESREFKCPKCRRRCTLSHDGITDFPVNFLLEEIKQVVAFWHGNEETLNSRSSRNTWMPGNVHCLFSCSQRLAEEAKRWVRQVFWIIPIYINNSIHNRIDVLRRMVAKHTNEGYPVKLTLTSCLSCERKPVFGVALMNEERIALVTGIPGKLQVHHRQGLAYDTNTSQRENQSFLKDAREITVLPNGNLAISDWAANIISVYGCDGEYVGTLGEGAGLDGPWGVCVLGNWNIAVCSPHAGNITVLRQSSHDGRYRLSAKISRFHLPHEDEQSTTTAMARFIYPLHIAPFKDNGFVVSDHHADAVYCFSLLPPEGATEVLPPGGVWCQWMYGGSYGSEIGMLRGPQGVATDRLGQVLIADTGNSRVILLSQDGEFLREVLSEELVKCPCSLSLSGDYLAVGQDDGIIQIYRYNTRKSPLGTSRSEMTFKGILISLLIALIVVPLFKSILMQ